MLNIQGITGAAELAAVFDLRRRLFGNLQSPAEYQALHPGAYFWGAYDPDLAGYIIAHAGASTLELAEGGVAPERRREGVASAGLRYALDWAAENLTPPAVVRLAVERTDVVARGLYAQFGFREYRVIPHYYGRGRDLIRAQVRL